MLYIIVYVLILLNMHLDMNLKTLLHYIDYSWSLEAICKIILTLMPRIFFVFLSAKFQFLVTVKIILVFKTKTLSINIYFYTFLTTLSKNKAKIFRSKISKDEKKEFKMLSYMLRLSYYSSKPLNHPLDVSSLISQRINSTM